MAPSDVQVMVGSGADSTASSEPALSEFVEVVVEATGQTTHVPRDWIDNPVLGKGIERTVPQKIADGDVTPADVADPPTARDSHEVIDAFAHDAEIDLGDARTKKQKVAVIEAALASQATPAGSAPAPAPAGDPDVQLTGPVDDLPIIPAAREAELARRAATTTNPDGTESSDETPAAGEEEN